MTQTEFDNKLAEKFAGERFTVLHYGKNSYDTSVFRCLDCGLRIEVKTNELFRARRKHICTKCHYKRADTKRNEDKVISLLSAQGFTNIEFYMEDSKGIRHHMVHYVCGKCNRVNTRRVANLLRQKEFCGYCSGHKQSKDTDEFRQELYTKYGNSFELLSEYVNATTPIRIRCNNCGFIRDIKPPAFLESGYCPKCGDKSSRGEKAIAQFLTEHGIQFETQKYFKDWDIGIHYFDFYVPQFNLVIEYHGRQHYEYVEYFHHTLTEFNERCQKDNEKKQAALEHGLNYVSISHKLYSQLNVILPKIFDSTTIPNGSRSKRIEIETIQDIG